jgi:hypothetical protein
MGVIKGQNLRLKIASKFVGFATSCTVHVSASLEDSSTKDSSDGIFQEQQLTGLAWDISTDALYSVDTDATGINAEGALDAILARQKVEIEFTGTVGTNNRQATGHKYTGQAWINDISINAANRQNASYSLQAQGTGPLTKSNGPSSSNL